jgi:seryl-tRNA synthetase
MTDLSAIHNDESEIVDADIVSENTSSQTKDDQATILLSLDEMIKTYVASLDRLSEEQKKLREMVADGLHNDAQYREVDSKAKEATKARNAIRQQIMGRSGVIEIANKLKNITIEIKEKKASLSDYVLEYQRMAGVNEVEVGNGEILEIVQVAKLVKKFRK